MHTASLGATRTLVADEVVGQLYASSTVTVNFVNAAVPALLAHGGTHVYLQAGITTSGANRVVWAGGTVKNDPSAAVSVGTTRNYDDTTAVVADAQVGLSAGAFTSYRSAPTYSVLTTGTFTAGTYVGFNSSPNVGASTTLSTATGFTNAPTVAGTVTTYTGFKVNNPTVTGTITTLYGLDIAALTVGGTNIGIRNSNTMRNTGAITIGADAAATWLLHVQGGNSATNALGLDMSTTGPTVPGSDAAVTVSAFRGSGGNEYIMFTFNDGGTTRYKYLPLNGTSVTIGQGTSLPA